MNCQCSCSPATAQHSIDLNAISDISPQCLSKLNQAVGTPDCLSECTTKCPSEKTGCVPYCSAKPPSGGGGGGPVPSHNLDAMRSFVKCVEDNKIDPASAQCMHGFDSCQTNLYDDSWTTSWCEQIGDWPECDNDGCKVVTHRGSGGGNGRGKGGNGRGKGGNGRGKGGGKNESFVESLPGKLTIGFVVLLFLILVILAVAKAMRKK